MDLDKDGIRRARDGGADGGCPEVGQGAVGVQHGTRVARRVVLPQRELDLKCTCEVLRLLAAEWANPSEALARHFAGQIYDGVKTKAVIEQFERATRKAMHQFLTGRIGDRL